MIGSSQSEASRQSSRDHDGGDWALLLSLLGLRIRWTDSSGDVMEVLERTEDQSRAWTGVLRRTIDAIQTLVDEVREKEDALSRLRRAPRPHPAAIDTLVRAIGDRHRRIDRLAREAVKRLRTRCERPVKGRPARRSTRA